MRRIVVCCLNSILILAGVTAIANAHPLGNFTINHLAKVVSSRGELKVRYVLDIAEIPTFQIMHSSASNASWTQEQLRAWGKSEVAVVSTGLSVSVDSARMRLRLNRHGERLRPGAGGLPILYWTGDFSIPLPAGKHRVAIDDGVYAGRRIGWKDVIVSPQTEPTHELLFYPNALLGSPKHVDAVTFDIAPDGRASNIAVRFENPQDVNGSTSIVRTSALSDLFSKGDRTPLFVLFTIFAAFGLGALHAIEPGHGKALLAFTLVGSRATVKQAGILAASLTFAHTIGVLVLGVALSFSASFVSESIYPWIALVSGVAVAAIGARNLARHLHAGQFHGGVIHAHAFTTDHHHGTSRSGHSHAIPGTDPLDFRAALVAATSGGVAPCPAAIVVMLAALRLHEIAYGIVLIIIFSFGLASVLMGLGIAIVHGSALVAQNGRFDRLVNAGPLLSAVLISIVGALMIGQGFVAQGVRAPAWVVAGLVILAIAGYGVAPQHPHVHSSEGQTT